MAERKSSTSPSTQSKGGASVFAKQVQRKFSRAQEKVLQKIGKSEETRDEHFETCVQNLHDQQSDGHRIYKDLKAYINAAKVMRDASSRLFQSLFDAYELDWEGGEDLGAVVEGEDLLWNDYETKLRDQALLTMESYISQFPDIKERVAKRGRKLVDYDSSRHHLESLQNAKKRDDIKISKAEEEMKTAKKIFEDMNKELKEELPVLYDSRIGCYVAVFQAVSNLRDIFYKEMAKNNQDLKNVMKDLKDQHPEKDFAVKNFSRGSLKRRSLKDALSPRSLRSSFYEFHMNYNPRGTLRRENTSSFRSERDPYEPYSPGTQTSPARPKPKRDPKLRDRDTDKSIINEDNPAIEGTSTTQVSHESEPSENAHSGTIEGLKADYEEKEKEEGESLAQSDKHKEIESGDQTGDLSQDDNKDKELEQGVNYSEKANSKASSLLEDSEGPEDHATHPQELNEPGSLGMENGISPNQVDMESEASWKEPTMNDRMSGEMMEETL